MQSTYKVRRSECDALAEAAGAAFGIKKLGDVTDEALLQVCVSLWVCDTTATDRRCFTHYPHPPLGTLPRQVCVCVLVPHTRTLFDKLSGPLALRLASPTL